MRHIDVVFYKPNADDQFLNHLVAFVSPPYSHCDLRFDDGVVTSIYQNESVYQERKSLSREGYEWVSLAFSDSEYDAIRRFCDSSFQRGVSFDYVGMILSYLPYNFRNSPDRTFCSKFVWDALQQSNRPEFMAWRSASMTPSRIFGVLDSTNKKFLNISERRLQLLK